jgi:hypothetical protein
MAIDEPFLSAVRIVANWTKSLAQSIAGDHPTGKRRTATPAAR